MCHCLLSLLLFYNFTLGLVPFPWSGKTYRPHGPYSVSLFLVKSSYDSHILCFNNMQQGCIRFTLRNNFTNVETSVLTWSHLLTNPPTFGWIMTWIHTWHTVITVLSWHVLGQSGKKNIKGDNVLLYCCAVFTLQYKAHCCGDMALYKYNLIELKLN